MITFQKIVDGKRGRREDIPFNFESIATAMAHFEILLKGEERVIKHTTIDSVLITKDRVTVEEHNILQDTKEVITYSGDRIEMINIIRLAIELLKEQFAGIKPVG